MTTLLEVVRVDELVVTLEPISVYVIVYVSVPVSPRSVAAADAVVVLTLCVYGAYSGNSEFSLVCSKKSLMSSVRSGVSGGVELVASGVVDWVEVSEEVVFHARRNCRTGGYFGRSSTCRAGAASAVVNGPRMDMIASAAVHAAVVVRMLWY